MREIITIVTQHTRTAHQHQTPLLMTHSLLCLLLPLVNTRALLPQHAKCPLPRALQPLCALRSQRHRLAPRWTARVASAQVRTRCRRRRGIWIIIMIVIVTVALIHIRICIRIRIHMRARAQRGLDAREMRAGARRRRRREIRREICGRFTRRRQGRKSRA